MCGILGILTREGLVPGVGSDDVVRMQRALGHRGPDGQGVWKERNAIFAHTRLAVRDLSEKGDQPMVGRGGRSVLVYNGELYNDAELRSELGRLGVVFESRCDTETVLRSLEVWGQAALDKFRGMYALAYFDVDTQKLVLARDPLGIKPLYYWTGTGKGGGWQFVFASEPVAILEHPDVPVEPDIATISSYLSTIRVTAGSRTMFRGVSALRAGERVTVMLSGARARIDSCVQPICGAEDDHAAGGYERDTRRVVTESVVRHLRSDVPMCCLLSGGLDSSIIAMIAARETGQRLTTYCAGAMETDEDSEGGDFHYARLMASAIDSDHHEAPVSEAMFLDRWESMIGRAGVPLSTPNEVAINEVARMMRQDGKVVTLSGEGADELFGGYVGPIEQTAAFAAEHLETGIDSDAWGRFFLDMAAWVPNQSKGGIFKPEVMSAIEEDAGLIARYVSVATQAMGGCAEPLQGLLRFQRTINLEGLLLRLDSATMLESIEGRTPLADVEVAQHAERLCVDQKIQLNGSAGAGRVAGTKVALRKAFGDELPEAVVHRAKASFPLPFEKWISSKADVVGDSSLVEELFTPEAVALVRADAERVWALAWPMINLAIWGRRWWG